MSISAELIAVAATKSTKMWESLKSAYNSSTTRCEESWAYPERQTINLYSITLLDIMNNILSPAAAHQITMGAGKTTVVTLHLALMLADDKSLVTQMVPYALLAFSRGVMREQFAAVVRKPVFTFQFDGSSPVNRELYLKLCNAQDSKKAAVICATPTSVNKSFRLKFVEKMRHLDEQNI